jgi:PAS domain S-box-containing protein
MFNDRYLCKIIDGSPVAAVLIRGSQFLHTNARFLFLVGVKSTHDIEKQSFSDFFLPECRKEIEKNIYNGIRSSAISSVFTAQCRHVNGSIVSVRIFADPLDLPDGIACMVHIIDITEQVKIEDALCASEERFQSLLNATHEAVYGVDFDGNCTFCNDACLLTLGYSSSDDLIGRNMHDLIHRRPDGTSFPRQECLITQCFRGGKSFHSAEEVFLRADKTFLPVEMWVRPQFHRGSFLTGAVVTFVDTTARKQSERTLRDNEQRFHQLYEHSMDGIFSVAVMPNSVFAYISFNPAQEKLMGLSTADVQGKYPKDILSSGLAAAFNAQCRQCVEQKVPVSYKEELPTMGGTVLVDITLVPFINDQGQIPWLLGISHVNADRKSATTALRDAATHLENIINTVADPIFVKDHKHRWVLVNDSFCSFVGHPREKLIGKSDYEFFPREQADVFWEKDELVFSAGKENINEEDITDSSGVIRTIITKKTLYANKQGDRFIVGTIRDISERKHMEVALRESEEKFRRLTEEALRKAVNGQG